MKGVKGCFLCCQYHHENIKHSTDDVTEASHKFKSIHPMLLQTVADLAFLVSMVCGYITNYVEEKDDVVRWVQDEDEEVDSELSFMALE